MERDEIVRKIKDLNLDSNQLWVTSSAALVLHGVKSNARDIDLGCSVLLWDELILKGYKYKQFEDGTYAIDIKSDIEIIKEYYVDEIIKIEGINVGSLESIKKQKQELGREKDLKDIKLIDEYINKKQNEQVF